MKLFFCCIAAFFIFPMLTFGQQRDSSLHHQVATGTLPKKNDTQRVSQSKKDTLLSSSASAPAMLSQKNPDSGVQTHSGAMPLHPLSIDSGTVVRTATGTPFIQRVLQQNKWINTKARPVNFITTEKESDTHDEIMFYGICALLLFLGLIKTIYSQYFSNLFRVYLNTSLRQSQLTEQLLQARWPSFLMNIFFVISSGLFVWLLFRDRTLIHFASPYLFLALCIGAVAAIYFIKFCVLKFIGWISGWEGVTNQYIFVIFLVNKLLSVIFIPFIILLAFSLPAWSGIISLAALLCTGIVFLSRYIKSYGLLGKKVAIHPFHFLLFFIGAELLPPLVIYKIATDYFIQG